MKEIFRAKEGRYTISVYKQSMAYSQKATHPLEDGMCRIVLFNRWHKTQCGGPFNWYDDSISNVNDMKHKYKGQTYVKFPIRYDRNACGFSLCHNEVKNDGYVLVSKRDIRSVNPDMMLSKAKDIRRAAEIETQKHISKFNAMNNMRLYTMVVSDGLYEQQIGNIEANSGDELKEFMHGNVQFTEECVGRMIDAIPSVLE